MKDEHGKSRRFGFISSELPEHAKMAMKGMNGAQLGSLDSDFTILLVM